MIDRLKVEDEIGFCSIDDEKEAIDGFWSFDTMVRYLKQRENHFVY